MKAELLQSITEDELILNCLYLEGDKDKPMTILVHGFTSDFYSHKFFHTIQEGLHENNLASCAIQNRGTGIRTEFIKKDREDGRWIGSFYELLEEAHLDISAWIEKFKDLGYSKFILAGHSLGTYKVVRYLFEGDNHSEIIALSLLAPFDKNGYIKRLAGDKLAENLRIANQEVENGNGEAIIPKDFDDYPMSYQSYISWYQDTELNKIWDFYKNEKYNNPLLKNIQIPVQIIVGDEDPFFYMPEFSTLESTKEILTENIKDLEINILENCEHTYVGFEDQVAELLIKFIAEKQ